MKSISTFIGFPSDTFEALSQAMTRKFETYTFSNSKFFSDRGPGYGVAEPITERINV